MSGEEVVQEETTGGRMLVLVRLVIGLAQGLALYVLYEGLDLKSWPATDSFVFAPLLLVAVFVPLILIQGAGNLRPLTLILWGALAGSVIAWLAWYDIWNAWPSDANQTTSWLGSRALPSAALFFFTAAGLFIGHALITGGDTDRKFVANYATHFDIAWKFGIQLTLSAAFVGIFWLVLWLGAALFNLIKLDFLEKLIEHRWFAIPATTLAISAALHVTDVRAGLVRGIRTLVLVLLSWLLPLMVLIAAGFLGSLVFTGLDPLWKTRHASGLLLAASAALVILINATYQDGDAAHRAPVFLRYAMRLAALLLVPTVALAAYALELRVQQYGWTADRIVTASCAIVAASYAIGYALSVFLADGWLMARWNFATSLLILAILIALFTPLADPARISVASQMARLKSGAVKPESFDFNYLRWEGGRYGHDALVALSLPKSPKAVREQALAALNSTTHYTSPTVPTVPTNLALRLTAYPKGRAIPQSFLATKWDADPSSSEQPSCVTSANVKCDLIFADMDGDGRDDIILVSDNEAIVYRDGGTGIWRIAGTFSIGYQCPELFRKALREGKIEPVEPAWHLKDIEILGTRLRPSTALVLDTQPVCPK